MEVQLKTFLLLGATLLLAGCSAPGSGPTVGVGQSTGGVRHFRAADVPGAAAAYRFEAEIPAGWRAEAVSEIEAINLYDPAAAGDSRLEKSQIFVRHFRAGEFLTLPTVEIFSREESDAGGRPTVTYDIAKKPGVPDLAGQPSWRSARHLVTDVRESDENPSTFYVFGRRPDLDPATFEAFLSSLSFPSQAALASPVRDLRRRVTLKRFGTYVSPGDSPVSPERFAGFHTGIDVEFGDAPGQEVPVTAAAAGTVLRSGRAGGYGGVVAVRHELGGELGTVVAVYGHLDPASLARVGTRVAVGGRLGVLGEGFTDATDGERKHLHLSLRRGGEVDLLGYVPRETDLAGWIDPLTLLP